MSNPTTPRQLTNLEVRDLADLNHDWGEAYEVTFDDVRGVFRARFLGHPRGDDVTDISVTSLREKMRHDYQFREGGLPGGG